MRATSNSFNILSSGLVSLSQHPANEENGVPTLGPEHLHPQLYPFQTTRPPAPFTETSFRLASGSWKTSQISSFSRSSGTRITGRSGVKYWGRDILRGMGFLKSRLQETDFEFLGHFKSDDKAMVFKSFQD